ncbi:MAG: nuclear transport factor 2 family protein [Gemmatimonadota bacterium]
MTEPADHTIAIRALRARSNEAIASRDVLRVVSFMAEDVVVRVAGGPMLRGRDASAAVFSEQFADASFRGYVRTPQHVTSDEVPRVDGVAAEDAAPAIRVTERGEWVGKWRLASGLHEQRGLYTAEWRLGPIGWQIMSETFTSAVR